MKKTYNTLDKFMNIVHNRYIKRGEGDSDMKQRLTAFGAGYDMTDAQKAHINRAVSVRDLADMIDNNDVVTVNLYSMTMEFTSASSPIIPYCIVSAKDVCGTLMLTAVAGPGQSTSEITLSACREVVQRRQCRARLAIASKGGN